jgi:acyl-CoA reductase-like NAD-dependent aldehyde dehydrogenase
VARIVFGAFYQSGQSCISVQRVMVHESIYESFRDRLVDVTKALEMGDPKDPKVFIGPMIAEGEAAGLEDWIQSAIRSGATLLCGGRRQGSLLEATLLEDVPRDQAVVCQEAFGPVAVLSRFSDFDAALSDVNDSVFGLQAGIFTRDIHKAHRAWDVLQVGGVVIGDVPSWRVDHMPYGGVKDSGIGREGVRWAIEHLTEVRLMVIRTPPR